MNEYVTGKIIKELREKYHFIQMELAENWNRLPVNCLVKCYIGVIRYRL